MKWRMGGAAPSEQRRSLPWLVFLALFFFCGAVLGQVLASGMPEATGKELERYLRLFLEESAPASVSGVLSAAVLYVRYPLLAALLGFATVGTALLCGLTAAFGFFLSFSVGCFAAAFGREGVLLALAALGVRCLVTLPCYFLLAVPAMENSAALFRMSLGRGRRAVWGGREWWLLLGVCAAALLAGACAEVLMIPRLVRWALVRALA